MQKATTSKMRGRMRIMLLLFMFCGFAVILVQLFKIQILDGEKYQSYAMRQQTRSTTLGAQRGTIYDRNMSALARSATVWNVCISPSQLDADTWDETAQKLSEILEVDKAEILEKATDKTSYYKIVKKGVERGVYDQVLAYTTEKEIDGVFAEEDAKRYYTYGSLASTVLGFCDYDNNGAYGLESYYNKTLSGQKGMVVSAKNAWGSDMPYKYQQKFEAQDGGSIVLTIDQSIQHFLERNLETAIVEHNIGNRAAGIVMNVKTGEILAMSTKPDFNPNDPYTLQDPAAQAQLAQYVEGTKEYEAKRKELWYDQWRNKAISDPYEPGSVFKIITSSTAIDNNLVRMDEHFYCTGSFSVSDRDIGCWKRGGHGDQNFIEGMKHSCNPVFIQLGQRIGGDRFYDYIENYGLGELSGIDLPGEANGILQSRELLNKEGMVELASTSFGQTFKVTPLQLITATSAAVNGGKLMQPFVVKQVLDSQGNVTQTTQPVVRRQVISEETSATMRMLTEEVVAGEGGSGRFAAVPGYRIGGKTGTSQKLDLDPNIHILSFVGFAPMNDPEIAVLVMLDEPELDDAFGSTIAAPIVGAVLSETLPYLGYEAEFTAEELAETEAEVPYLVGETPHDAQAKLTALGLKTRMVGTGMSVLRQIPQSGQTMSKGGTVIIYASEEEMSDAILVPDVVGMTAQAANAEIVGKGLNIELRGVPGDGVPTQVVEQWPLPGERASTGDVVLVTLAEKEEEIPGAAQAANAAAETEDSG